MNFELSAFFSFSLPPAQSAPTPAGPSPGQPDRYLSLFLLSVCLVLFLQAPSKMPPVQPEARMSPALCGGNSEIVARMVVSEGSLHCENCQAVT